MIVWLNGAFGVGKSTVAGAVRRALPAAHEFDPELIGWVLRRVGPVPTGDYQDLRRWRRLVVLVAAALDRARPGTLIVPMTLLGERSTTEILGGLRDRARDVRHVLLEVTAAELERRIATAPAQGGRGNPTRSWRLAHVAAYERERPRLLACADIVLDTTARPPEEVAAALVDRLRG